MTLPMASLTALAEESSTELDSNGCFTLNTGAKMPAVGLGTWEATDGEGKLAVSSALAAGYRLLDCAHLYGNEVEVGEALAESWRKSEAPLKREEVFVTSKLWCNSASSKSALQACERSLKNLGLTYLDLYLLHWPTVAPRGDPTDPPHSERPGVKSSPSILPAWQAMEELVRRGLVRAIGVSNFSIHQLEELLQNAKIAPAVNQVELHPLWRQEELLSFCAAKGIHVSAHTPLGIPGNLNSPIFSPGTPGFSSSSGYSSGSDTDTSSTLTSRRHSRGGVNGSGGREESRERPSRSRSRSVHAPLVRDEAVLRTAAKLGRTPTQVILRWAIQRGTSVLPRSVRAEKIRSNLDVLSWELSAEDWTLLNSLEPQVRLVDGTWRPFHTWMEEEEEDGVRMEGVVEEEGRACWLSS